MFSNKFVVIGVAVFALIALVGIGFGVARLTAPKPAPQPSLESVMQSFINADNSYRASQQQRANPITGAQGNQTRCGVCGTMKYKYAIQCPGCGTQSAPNFGS